MSTEILEENDNLKATLKNNYIHPGGGNPWFRYDYHNLVLTENLLNSSRFLTHCCDVLLTCHMSSNICVRYRRYVIITSVLVSSCSADAATVASVTWSSFSCRSMCTIINVMGQCVCAVNIIYVHYKCDTVWTQITCYNLQFIIDWYVLSSLIQ